MLSKFTAIQRGRVEPKRGPTTFAQGQVWNRLTDNWETSKQLSDGTKDLSVILSYMAQRGVIERVRSGRYWLYRLPQPENFKEI